MKCVNDMKIGEIVTNHGKAIMQRYINKFTCWKKLFNKANYKVFRRRHSHTYHIGTVSYKVVTLKLIWGLS